MPSTLSKKTAGVNHDVFSETLTLNGDGMRATETDTRFTDAGTLDYKTKTLWTYDGEDKLTEEKLELLQNPTSDAPAPYDHRFHYDGDGNRSEEDDYDTQGNQIGTIYYFYNADDQLHIESNSMTNESDTDTYDAEGNLSTAASAVFDGLTVTTTYTYDLQNHMTEVSAVSQPFGGIYSRTVTTYGYDTDGIIAWEQTQSSTTTGTASATTYYLNDPNNPTGYTKAIELKTGTTTANAMITRSYVLGLRVEAQAGLGTDAESHLIAVPLYLLTDTHGSTRSLVTATGKQEEEYDYTADGNLTRGVHYSIAINGTVTVTTITEATAATFWFAGDGWYDAPSGVTIHEIRPVKGFEYTESDFGPYGNTNDPLSQNKYILDNGDPENGWDPTGHDDTIASELTVTGLQAGLIAASLATLGFSLQLAKHTAVFATAASAALNDIEGLISSGSAALEAEGAKLLGKADQVAEAIDDAINDALKAGRQTLSQLSNLKVFPIVRSAGPKIYAFDVAALAGNPSWYVLNYNGLTPAGTSRTATNRAFVFAKYGKIPAPSKQQLDEFPFASTLQGGLGPFGPALGKYVPATENSLQGTLLGLFYYYELGWSTVPFLVVPIGV